MSPSDAAERWLSKRSTELRDQTLRDYGYRIERFVEFCDGEEIDSMRGLTPWLVDQFDAERRGDLAPITVRNHNKTIKDWLEWCETVGVCSDGVSDALEVPDVARSDHVSDVRLEPDDARRLLETWRSGPNSGTKHHVTLELLWHVGCRMGGLRAVDLSDVDRDAGVLELRHRPELGTPLKRGEQGERDVGLREPVADVLEKWIDAYRPTARDDHGREPLLATRQGRVATSTLRDWSYYATAPCRYESCPHDREQSTCDWFQTTSATECPSTRSPHQIRSGAITWMRHQGFGVERVARRVNSSVRMIKKHYDLASEREEFENREAEQLEKLTFEDNDN